MKYTPPKTPPPDSINNSNKNPLKSFFELLLGAGFILALIYFLLFSLGFIFSKLISYNSEVKLLSPLINMTTQGQNSPPLSKLIRELWAGVDSNEVHFSGFVATGAPNAFITPGGAITVTSQLVQQSESENELAFVLCHELGHFYYRHSLRGLFTNMFHGLFSYLVAGNFSNGLPKLALLATSTQFSQNQEMKADEFALDCLSNKYKHVNGYTEFFKKASKKEYTFQKLYFRSHPLSVDRINHLKEYLEKKHYQTEGPLSDLNKKIFN